MIGKTSNIWLVVNFGCLKTPIFDFIVALKRGFVTGSCLPNIREIHSQVDVIATWYES